jgi:hypothetical protein
LGENIGKQRGKIEASVPSLPGLGSVADRFCIFRDYFALTSSHAQRQARPGVGKAHGQIPKRAAKRMNSVLAKAAALL